MPTDAVRGFDVGRVLPGRFWAALSVIVLVGLTRSWIATSLDALQIDEAWHAVAGVSYVRTGDYRLNPEHPPLVKLWAGATLPASFELPPFRLLDDKEDERKFVETAFFLDNDSEQAQRSVRLSMLAFHAMLLLALGWTLRRALGPALALVAIALLLIDPTVAAHLPVVLTDLPMALLSTSSALLAFFAFRSWRASDLWLASGALGLVLGSKHSALPFALSVCALGVVCACRPDAAASKSVIGARLARVAAVMLGAYVTLWALYGFHFDELGWDASVVQAGTSGEPTRTFNRTIEDKLSDLEQTPMRALIEHALEWRVLPRAYLWGLADIVRAGLESRTDTYVLGEMIRGASPWYFFPLALAVKLPLGLVAFALAGMVLLARRRVPAAWSAPLAVLLTSAAIHLLLLMRGNSSYAGIRHALPVYPSIALLAAIPIVIAFAKDARAAYPRTARIAVGVVLALTLLTALPHLRPWEYYNELVGGPDNAWRYFADEGVDSGQRVKELTRYYDAHLRGSGEHAYDFYGLGDVDRKAGRLELRTLDQEPADADAIEGTVFIGSTALLASPAYDHAAFREAKPIARFGNLLVFRGKFRIPWLQAERKSIAAYEAMDGDAQLAEKLLSELISMYPQDHHASFELANLLLERGDQQAALGAYSLSRKHAPPGDPIIDLLTRQIDALSRRMETRPIRAPWLE